MKRLAIHGLGLWLGLCSCLVVAAAPQADPGFRPELVGVELTSGSVRPSDSFALTLKFKNSGTRAAAHAYRVFTHIEAPKQSCENIVMQADHEPTEPTTAWQPGEVVVDGPHLIAVPPETVEQEYYIHVGVFDADGSGGRLLDKYAAVKLHVTAAATPSSQLAPKPLTEDEIVTRRRALASRVPTSNRIGLETDTWRWDIDAHSGAWILVDKKTNKLWTSDPTRARFGRITLRKDGRTITADIGRLSDVSMAKNVLRFSVAPKIDDQPTGVRVEFTATAIHEPDGVRLAYRARSAGVWDVDSVELLERAFTVTDDGNGVIYVPHRLGIEITARDGLPSLRRFTTYNSLSMAMCGAVDTDSALLVNWSKVDAHLLIQKTWPDLPLVPGRRACALSLVLEGPEGECTIHPIGHGGYVEIATAYRQLATAKGWRKTWSEKRRDTPTVDRMFGAVDFKPFVFTRVVPTSRYSRDGREHSHVGFTFAEAAQCAEHWKNDLKIDRAFVVLAGWINGGYDVRHPDVLPAAPECGGNEALQDAARRIKACGYLFGLHDNYQDMYEDAPSWDEKWLNKDARGVARKGGNWNGGQAWQVCAIEQVKLAARPKTNLPEIAQLFQPTIYFIDTVFAWPLVTCEDPAHPMRRLDDLHWKTRLCLLAKKYFGLFGSEEGREWAVPCADYLEGIFNHQTESPTGQVIPLFPLVYSDCVQLTTHQSYRIGPGDEKKVADHILFAEMFLPKFGSHLYWKTAPRGPVGSLDVSRDGHVAFVAAEAETSELWSRADNGWGEDLCVTDRVIKNVSEVLSPLNQVTAESPLSCHEFLTPDRLLQRTCFNDLTITVAYEKPASVGDNKIPPYGFVIEGPTLIAFCATRYNGVDYARPALFVARSLDGQPIRSSAKVRIFHGFGDPHIRLFGKEFTVGREDTVSLR